MNAQARPLLLAAFAIGFAFAGPAHGQTPVKHLYYPDADSKAEIGRALAAAKAANKRVMIVFGSDWCVDCWVLDLTMHNPEIKPIVDENYEVVKVDIGRWDMNLDINQKYGNPIEKGVPAVVILDAKGEFIASTKEKPWENARALKLDVVRDQLKAWAKITPLGSKTEHDVTVEFRLVHGEGNKDTLCGRFVPKQAGFHLYGAELPAEGINGIGRPTRLRLVSSTSVRATGPAVADQSSVAMKVETLGLTFPVYPAGPVNLCMPVQIAAGKNRSVELAVTYMTCSDRVCMPPVEDRRITVYIDDPYVGGKTSRGTS